MTVSVLLIGNGAREHAIAEALLRRTGNRFSGLHEGQQSGHRCPSSRHPFGSLQRSCRNWDFAKAVHADFAVIGPEDPLNNGVVDALQRQASRL